MKHSLRYRVEPRYTYRDAIAAVAITIAIYTLVVLSGCPLSLPL